MPRNIVPELQAVADHAIGEVDLDPQVAPDAGDRVDRQAGHLSPPPDRRRARPSRRLGGRRLDAAGGSPRPGLGLRVRRGTPTRRRLGSATTEGSGRRPSPARRPTAAEASTASAATACGAPWLRRRASATPLRCCRTALAPPCTTVRAATPPTSATPSWSAEIDGAKGSGDGSRRVGRPHRVPEPGDRAADAAVAGLDRPARPVGEPDGRAVGEGLGALAAHLVEAPALLRPLVAPGHDELAELEVGAPLALVVDEAAVGEERPMRGVGRRPRLEGQVVDDRGGQVVDVDRAAGQVDQRGRPTRPSRDPDRPGRAAARRAGAPPSKAHEPTAIVARAPAQTSRTMSPEGPAADHAVRRRRRASRDGPLDDRDVAVRRTASIVSDPGELGRRPRTGAMIVSS